MKLSDLPVVIGERTLLEQTFTNLFQNAINYRRKDLPLEISVTTRPAEIDVVVCVTDNGIGIAPQHHKKIFEAFQRLQVDQESQGTGLGLANVKKSVETQGGEVWVESEIGKGSTFCVKLKRAA